MQIIAISKSRMLAACNPQDNRTYTFDVAHLEKGVMDVWGSGRWGNEDAHTLKHPDEPTGLAFDGKTALEVRKGAA